MALSDEARLGNRGLCSHHWLRVAPFGCVTLPAECLFVKIVVMQCGCAWVSRYAAIIRTLARRECSTTLKGQGTGGCFAWRSGGCAKVRAARDDMPGADNIG